MSASAKTFEPAMLDGLADPVRRYLEHSIKPGTPLAASWRLQMKGTISAGIRLPFEATQDMDGNFFTWRARVPSKRLRILEVTDSYREGEGGMVGRFAGWNAFSDVGEDAARSAATRTVMESTMVPATLLPGSGVEWSSSTDWELRYRRPGLTEAEEVTVRIDRSGRAFEVEAPRWRKEKGQPGKLIPFVCRFEGESDLAGMKVPRKLVAGWDKSGFEPFFEARVTSIEGISVP